MEMDDVEVIRVAKDALHHHDVVNQRLTAPQKKNLSKSDEPG
jgi:hypothetical protein